MSYDYQEQKPKIFTEEGQKNFLIVRDSVKRLLKIAGAFREDFVDGCASSWETMACLDRLVELKEIVVLRDNCWRQYRVYSDSRVHNR